MLNFDHLKTPSADGEVLVEPPAAHWPALLEQSLKQAKQQTIHLAGIPVQQIRENTRKQIWGISDQTPVIAGAHQPDFAHPGVWAKHVAVRQTSKQLAIIGGHLEVDNDAPKRLTLHVPAVEANGIVSLHEIEFLPGNNQAAYEKREPLKKEMLQRIQHRIANLMQDAYDKSPMPDYLEGMVEAKTSADFVEQHQRARIHLDRTLKADVTEARVSATFGGFFLADLLINAGPFATAYNNALADYRRSNAIRNNNRPLPDLGHDDNRIETAFWIYQPLQHRRRLWIARKGQDIILFADGLLVGRVNVTQLQNDPDQTVALLAPWVIRPRALTLTLWARLLACDLFVHGIGGAKYDRITDKIFHAYYKCTPPPYTCVSATLQLPLPVQTIDENELSTTRRRLRDIQFNPDRYLPNTPSPLWKERARLIGQSDRLRQNRGSKLKRRQVFLDIRRVNRLLAESAGTIKARLLKQELELENRIESNRIAQNREFFYALAPRQRLNTLADRIATSLGDLKQQ